VTGPADPLRSAPAMALDVDETVPNAARVYDYLLGGYHNFAVDRELAEKMIAGFPLVKQGALNNRAWVNRVVIDSLDAGVRQFLDIGSGVPTVGNVHEIVRDHLPEGESATVVYVDYEPVAAHHAHLILQREGVTDWAGIVQEDLRHPDAIFDHPDTTRLIDRTRPVALLMVALLHFLGPDDHPDELLATYRDRLAPGSRLAINHLASGHTEETATEAEHLRTMTRNSSNPTWWRSRDEIRSFFGDWHLLHYPDLTSITDWLPEPDYEITEADIELRPFGWCGVAEKPAKPEAG
jgi:S-adenosyl methyltransferase